MNPEALKYILDIESVIAEIEDVIDFTNNDFKLFSQNQIAIRAIERNLEIVGEAVRKLRELGFELENADKIIGLRNIIAHAYDSVDNFLLWNIINQHIPDLKKEIKNLRT